MLQLLEAEQRKSSQQSACLFLVICKPPGPPTSRAPGMGSPLITTHNCFFTPPHLLCWGTGHTKKRLWLPCAATLPGSGDREGQVGGGRMRALDFSAFTEGSWKLVEGLSGSFKWSKHWFCRLSSSEACAPDRDRLDHGGVFPLSHLPFFYQVKEMFAPKILSVFVWLLRDWERERTLYKMTQKWKFYIIIRILIQPILYYRIYIT